ncbi:hypothetical protein BDP27DRAFT_1320997 [Rhodocollybia butyracea]|uniref:Uncharacterized protein n=1 Tax=Rhodocollybia butyracea TaxID=206335 RepID=A0A9P5Q168_9AGAR|nr:hypothetical protein BDP27DRAFT_1320997 [Rhodocollybia butyracea]
MTPEEVVEFSDFGLVVYLDLIETIVILVLSGIYCLALCIALYIYWQETHAAGAKKTMICVLLGTFVPMLLIVVSSVVIPGIVKYGLVTAATQTHIIVYNAITSWSSNIIIGVTDAVIVWRAWAMWMDNRKVRWTLLLLMLADIGVSLADCIADFSSNPTTQSHAITLDWVNLVLSLSVNMIATCLIAVRVWLHHKSIKSISITRKWTKGERILLLLVESGAIYLLLQLLCIIIIASSVKAPLLSPIACAAVLATALYTVGAAVNPIAIFILVQTQNTYEQSFHLEEISALSQQAQSQQVSVILSSGPEGTPTDVGFVDQETNMIHNM